MPDFNNLTLQDIDKLKSNTLRKVDKQIISDIVNQWKTEGHMVNKIPDKVVLRPTDKTDDNGNPINETVLQKVNKIPFPFQKKIVNTAVPFAFGNEPDYTCEAQNDAEKEAFNVIKRIMKKVKVKSLNRRVYRELLRSTEVAEYWYIVPTDSAHNEYGQPCKYKVRVKKMSIADGDSIYPYFDEFGDMVAFSREYEVNGVGYFDVWTAEKFYRFQTTGEAAGMLEGYPKANELRKIPVVYMCQDQTDWQDVQVAIDRLEHLLSKFAETNDYHASPTIFITGEIKGMPAKGEAGKILEGEAGSSVQYVSWTHAPESVRLEIETLLKFIYSHTQTPDISFDNVKGIGSISGTALEILFLDAYLKVEEKREILDDYLDRRMSVIQSIASIIFGKSYYSDLSIYTEIVPFRLSDKSELISNLVTATGGAKILSQKTAVQLYGQVEDVESELAQINEETKAIMQMSIEPTNL